MRNSSNARFLPRYTHHCQPDVSDPSTEWPNKGTTQSMTVNCTYHSTSEDQQRMPDVGIGEG